MTTSKPYTLDRITRIVIALLVVAVLLYFVNRLRTVLLPFAIGWILAYIFHPVVLFFRVTLRLKSNVIATICTMLSLLIASTGLIWFLSPMINAEIDKFSALITLYTQDLTVDSFLPASWQSNIRELLLQLDFEEMLTGDNLKEVLHKIAPRLLDIINSSLAIVFGVIVALVILLYFVFISIYYENLNLAFTNIIPKKFRQLTLEIIADLKDAMKRYFRGQFLIALIDAVLYSIAFSILGLPLALILGVAIGLVNIIPFMQLLGIIPALLLGLLKAAETGQNYFTIALIIIVIFIVIQAIEQLILVPKIMGKATGMNPAIILLSLSIWGSLLGILGMIIALPFSVIILSYYQRFIIRDGDTIDEIQKDNEEDTVAEDKK